MNSMVLIFHSYVNVYQRVTPIFPRVHPIDLTGGCSIHLTGKLLLWQLWKIMWEMTGLLIKLALVHPCIIHIKIPYIIYIYIHIYIYIYITHVENPKLGGSSMNRFLAKHLSGRPPRIWAHLSNLHTAHRALTVAFLHDVFGALAEGRCSHHEILDGSETNISIVHENLPSGNLT